MCREMNHKMNTTQVSTALQAYRLADD
jgi:hypothetical protein